MTASKRERGPSAALVYVNGAPVSGVFEGEFEAPTA